MESIFSPLCSSVLLVPALLRFLEVELKRKLDVAARSRRRDRAESRVRRPAGRGIDRAQVGRRRTQVPVVDRVEEVGLEGEVETFRDRESLASREVKQFQCGTLDHTHRAVAK